MKILVTGGAGFIGSNLIERLLSRTDYELICLDDFNDYYSPAVKWANVEGLKQHPRVRLVRANFCDAAAMRALFSAEAIGAVVHLGAYAGVRASMRQPLLFEENNVRGTLVLLEMAREFPVKRFVFVSSSTVYGRDAAVPFREDQPLGVPLSPYGATKHAAELLTATYCHLHAVPTVCVRPFSVYGPRLRPDLALYIFAAAILRGEPVPLNGDGSIQRDFTHVDDICNGLLAAIEKPTAVGQCINLGSHRPYSMRQVIEQLSEVSGKQANVQVRPSSPGELPVTCADLTRAGRLLGYAPQVELADGLRDFVDWFRASVLAG